MIRNVSPEPFNEESILYTDLYKLTMGWAVLKLFPTSKVTYQFTDRADLVYPKGFDRELRKVVAGFANRKLSAQRKKELTAKCKFLPAAYIDFLYGYRYDPSEVGIIQDSEGKLHITISGYWYRTIHWEVSLMNAICKLYYEMTGQIIDVNTASIRQNNQEKANFFRMNSMKVADFGTRRAYSPENHKNVVEDLINYAGESFIGTSNVELACAYGVKAIGTYAHEFVSGVSSVYGYTKPNYFAMEKWVEVYNGNLGIALTDTYTTDMFLLDFNSKYANLYTGVRHDSGDPIEFIDKMINHYNELGIDPTTKTIVFSDGLNGKELEKISNYRPKEIRRTYGIGTWLTNDIPNVKAMNIVIKLIEIDGHHVIKISDNPIKAIGNKETIDFALWQVNQQIAAYKTLENE